MIKEKLLEVGCGVNPHFQSTYEKDTTFQVGLDFDINLLRQLKEHDEKRALVVGDAKQLPFKNDSFDRVDCHHVLEHVPQSQQAIDEISRVTKSGGAVDISVPHHVYDTVMAVSLLGYFKYWSEGNHINIFTPEKITNMVRSSGIEILHTEKKGWWRAVATIKNYLTARFHNEPINGHTQRIVSERQQKLLEKKDEFLLNVKERDQKAPLLNKVIPYETVIFGIKN